MSTTIPGGYSNWNFNIPQDVQEVFEEALSGILGVEYKPLAYASQVVAGANYTFLCQGQVITPEMPYFPGLLHIFKPLGSGSPELKGIDAIPPGPSTGFDGWTPWEFGPNAEAMAIFEQARGNWVGQGYEMLAHAKKVSGGLHRFLMKATSVTANPVESAVVFDVQTLLGGKPIIVAQRDVPPSGQGFSTPG